MRARQRRRRNQWPMCSPMWIHVLSHTFLGTSWIWSYQAMSRIESKLLKAFTTIFGRLEKRHEQGSSTQKSSSLIRYSFQVYWHLEMTCATITLVIQTKLIVTLLGLDESTRRLCRCKITAACSGCTSKEEQRDQCQSRRHRPVHYLHLQRFNYIQRKHRREGVSPGGIESVWFESCNR